MLLLAVTLVVLKVIWGVFAEPFEVERTAGEKLEVVLLRQACLKTMQHRNVGKKAVKKCTHSSYFPHLQNGHSNLMQTCALQREMLTSFMKGKL